MRGTDSLGQRREADACSVGVTQVDSVEGPSGLRCKRQGDTQEAAAEAAAGSSWDEAEGRKRMRAAGVDTCTGTGTEEGVQAPALVSEELARHDPALSLEANGWVDEHCVHCKQSRAEGCRGYYVPIKRKVSHPPTHPPAYPP